MEERREDIEDQILNNIIPSFAHEYRERDSLDLDEFIEKYKEKFDLNNLDDKTRAELGVQYDEIVDKNPKSGSSTSVTTDSHGTDPSGPLQRQIEEALAGAQIEEPDLINSDLAEMNPILGLSIRQEQKLEKARENLQNKKNEIEILKQRQGRLKREKERLHPEDLVPTLVANVATIILSVVIPIIIYLIFVTNSAVVLPNWAWIISHAEVNVFLSWLLGLCVVFESIYARINDREPKAYSVYQGIRKYFSPKRS